MPCSSTRARPRSAEIRRVLRHGLRSGARHSPLVHTAGAQRGDGDERHAPIPRDRAVGPQYASSKQRRDRAERSPCSPPRSRLRDRAVTAQSRPLSANEERRVLCRSDPQTRRIGRADGGGCVRTASRVARCADNGLLHRPGAARSASRCVGHAAPSALAPRRLARLRRAGVCAWTVAVGL